MRTILVFIITYAVSAYNVNRIALVSILPEHMSSLSVVNVTRLGQSLVSFVVFW